MTDQIQVNTLESLSSQVGQIMDLVQQINNQVNMIPANKVYVTNGLSDIDGSLGMVVAGEFRAGKGNPGKATDPFTGVRMAYPSMTYNSSPWNIVGVSQDVLQFGLNASDGKAYAGAGSVVLDASGIDLVNYASGSPSSYLSMLKWGNPITPDSYMFNESIYSVHPTNALHIISNGNGIDKGYIEINAHGGTYMGGPPPGLMATVDIFAGSAQLELQNDITAGTSVAWFGSGVNVGIGTPTLPSVRLGQLLEVAVSANYGGISASSWTTTASQAPLIETNRSKSATIGTHSAVASGDAVGKLTFRGSDGSQFLNVSQINGYVDGAVGSGSVPGRLEFATTGLTGVGSTKLTIDSAGDVYTVTPTTYSPAATGLTTPVYGAQTGYYKTVGKTVYCWGRLDITSWAGQSGAIRVTLPVSANTAVHSGTLSMGTAAYFRNGTSTQQGTHLAIYSDTNNFQFLTNDVSGSVPWEASARVIIYWQLVYQAA